MKINWNEIETAIIDYYKEINLEITSNELNYLKNAFEFIEKLWEEQFKKIKEIKYIMISEAPLFGKEQKYFYNPNSKFSSFFYFTNIEAFDIQYTKQDYNNKKFILDILNEKGFLILDLFPFALNKVDTQINYNSVNHKEYQKLFQINLNSYLIKKLNLVKTKCDENTTIFYRYKRLKKKLGGVLETELEKLNLIKEREDLDCVNNNMSLDKEKLNRIVLK